MKCPAEVSEAILEILYRSTLAIRGAGWSGNAEQCAAFADHIHNLPNMLRDYKPELLDYYWNIERSCFLRDAQKLGIQATLFEDQWSRIEPLVPHPQEARLRLVEPLAKAS